MWIFQQHLSLFREASCPLPDFSPFLRPWPLTCCVIYLYRLYLSRICVQELNQKTLCNNTFDEWSLVPRPPLPSHCWLFTFLTCCAFVHIIYTALKNKSAYQMSSSNRIVGQEEGTDSNGVQTVIIPAKLDRDTLRGIAMVWKVLLSHAFLVLSVIFRTVS